MKREIVTIIAIFAFFGQMASAQTDGNASASEKPGNISVSIRYFDRTMYYPGNADANPIFVHTTIRNEAEETLRFKLADDRMFSIDFFTYSVKNAQLPQTDTLIRRRTTNQTVYFREISLEQGEEYSFIENLKNYIDITDPSVYYIELKFYPELYKSKHSEVTSNRLMLEIRPSPAAAATVLPVKERTAELLRPEEIPPDKVVEQTIIARQKSLWDQYFLYMDVEAMLQRTPSAKRKYTNVSTDERARMLERYKADLVQSKIDSDIVAIPERFEIERTVYNRTDGTVTVIEWFKYPNYHEKKSYVYKVRQREGIWQIYDYTVTNLGTE